MINVILVDDESLYTEGLKMLISSNPNINVLETFNDGNVLVEKLKNQSISTDIIFVDIQMQPINGFDLVEKIKSILPEQKIIVLSSHYKQAMFGQMVSLGVSAFLPKSTNRDLLMNAIFTVYNQGVFLTDEDQIMLKEYMNNKPKRFKFQPENELTEREKDILKAVCQEKTNQEIANELFLSKRTVETHRQHLLDKTGAKNTVGLVIYAIAKEIYKPIIFNN